MWDEREVTYNGFPLEGCTVGDIATISEKDKNLGGKRGTMTFKNGVVVEFTVDEDNYNKLLSVYGEDTK